MKSKYKAILAACGLGMCTFTSCTDGYEAEPVENFTLDYVFSTTDSVGKQAVYYLNNIYRHLSSGHNRVGGDYLDAATDDALSLNFDKSTVYSMVMGRYTANNRIADMGWDEYYQTIREATIFIANIDRVPFNIKYTKGVDSATGELTPLNVTMKAEARFLRAYAYFELVKRYGGVPLTGEKVFTLEDNLELPRNSFAECIDYIVSELDLARPDLRGLPMQGSDASNYIGCPTGEACLALKTRVLLYAASKLFNESPLEPGNEAVGYPSYDVNRWKLAADAAAEFIATYGHMGSNNIRLASNFRKAFLSFYNGSDNPEIIWYIAGENTGTNLEKTNGPLGFTGNAIGEGRTLPTQNLVDAFPMLDGKTIGHSDKYAYDETNMYANRDPRLKMTVLHNGANWLGRQLSLYQGGAHNPSTNNVYNRTGYYMCKFMDDYSAGKTEYQGSIHPWVVLRYAEVLLNYAEAQNEFAGPDESVVECLVQLRRRAGIEAGDDGRYGIAAGITKDEMRELIYNERRIEMAFEEQRYYDIRRWKLAEAVYAQPVRGLKLVYRDGRVNQSIEDVLTVKWDNRRYLYPIPYSEVMKNSNMTQNPKW